ncbi:MAG: hypothetical protein AABY22_10105 [Nanoarchaeota archaeon]
MQPKINDYELEQMQFKKYKKVFYVLLNSDGIILETIESDLTDEGRRKSNTAKSNGFVLDQRKRG